MAIISASLRLLRLWCTDSMTVFSLPLWLIRSNRFLLLERAAVGGSDDGVQRAYQLACGCCAMLWIVLHPASRVQFAPRGNVRREVTCSISKEAERPDHYILKPATVYRRKFSFSLPLSSPFSSSRLRRPVCACRMRDEKRRGSHASNNGNVRTFLFATRDMVYKSIF